MCYTACNVMCIHCSSATHKYLAKFLEQLYLHTYSNAKFQLSCTSCTCIPNIIALCILDKLVHIYPHAYVKFKLSYNVHFMAIIICPCV